MLGRKIYFGGSFYPPHLAHTEILQMALDHDKTAEIVIIPTKQNPLKESPGASAALVEAWFKDLSETFSAEDFARCRLDGIEMNSEAPKNYTVETLKMLKKEGEKWTLLIGSDSAEAFSRWRNPAEIMSLLEEIWVVPRGNFDTKREAKMIENSFKLLDKNVKTIFLNHVSDISSSALRNEAMSHDLNGDWAEFLSPNVLSVWKKLQS